MIGMIRWSISGSAVVGALMIAAGGCGQPRGGQVLHPQSATMRGRAVEEMPLSPVDQPGALDAPAVGGTPAPDATSPDAQQPDQPNNSKAIPSPAPQPAPDKSPRSDVSNPPGDPSSPATRGVASGEYLTVGGVVAEVNGIPIYANRVLATLQSALQSKAEELDLQQFRAVARDLIERQVNDFITAEVTFAAAQRNLDAQDKSLVDALTTEFRQRRITEAGGSVELAKRKAIAEGADFEDLVQDKYRENMIRVYYQKKLFPKIQVSARDIREYYNANLDTEFTERDQMKFRLIKIDQKEAGSREAAFEQIKQVRQNALGEADFAKLAGSTNHDPLLKRNGGDVGWIQRGSFRLEKVEQAVWELQPGQVSGIIDEGNAFYLAKLEETKSGSTVSFEDQKVQDKIREKLRGEQLADLRRQVEENLRGSAIIRTNPEMVSTALEMALQRYPQWATKTEK